ncbi:hypothetical protein EXIGLDRAFT_847933 [Exidia glandulosa HHB12029]|uniref:Uncharacterized protein n=1 Tax=Exidia glandulosa HHB12029 TaxID=1314781 RepID=A0A166MCC4_EXIGL|nr:hypothetical protein EXIGLDRAFT_847933 [Exidia glandulosa HHB12029]
MYNNTHSVNLHPAHDRVPPDQVNRTARNKNTKSALSTKSAYALDSGTRSRRAAGATIRFKLKNPAHGSRAQQPAPKTKLQLEKQVSSRLAQSLAFQPVLYIRRVLFV